MKRSNHGSQISIWILIIVLVPASYAGTGAEKPHSLIRQNPFVRAYFREKALSLQPRASELKDERWINSVTDSLIDAFTEKVKKLTERLNLDTEELRKSGERHFSKQNLDGAPASRNAQSNQSIRDIRNRCGKIKSTVKELKSELSFLVTALKFEPKEINIAPYSGTVDALLSDIKELNALAGEFSAKITGFLFARPGSVSLEELQTASFPLLLKKLEMYIDRVENSVKKL